MNRRLIVTLSLVVTVLAVALTSYTVRLAQRPLYEVGQLAVRPVGPPLSMDGGRWEVEPGITLDVRRHGAGPRVVWVHGGPGVPLTEPLPDALQQLARRFELITYDQRGCGGSTRPYETVDARDAVRTARELERRLGLTAQAADLERIRAGLEDEQLVLVGHGFGALLASLYAAERPQHRAQLLEYHAVAARTAGYAVPPLPAPGVTGGFSVQAAWLGLGLAHDWRPFMRRVSAPVLVIHGGKDLMSEAAARDLAAAFPRASVEVLRSAGPYPYLDEPDTFAAVVGAFLERAGAP